jgi:dihydrofolate synthase/folylpolyglutamate synthase
VEKAGIIKPETPLVIGNVTGASKRILEATALQQNSECYAAIDLKPEWNNGSVTLKDGDVKIKTLFKEAVNKWNVVSSWLVIDVLKSSFPINEAQRILSIEKFTGAPGRFEKIHSDYEWFFSGSHNDQALESSLQAVQAIKSISETVLVFSAMKDKLNEDMLMHFKGFKKAYFVEQDGERAAKFSDIKDSLDVELMEETQKENILNELKTELVIFMGSFYFYPIVKRWTANVS